MYKYFYPFFLSFMFIILYTFLHSLINFFSNIFINLLKRDKKFTCANTDRNAHNPINKSNICLSIITLVTTIS